MISGLLKLMPRLSFTGYKTDFEVASRTHFITDDNLASRKIRRARFLLGTFLLPVMNWRDIEDTSTRLAH
jgi:hypothetical protein